MTKSGGKGVNVVVGVCVLVAVGESVKVGSGEGVSVFVLVREGVRVGPNAKAVFVIAELVSDASPEGVSL